MKKKKQPLKTFDTNFWRFIGIFSILVLVILLFPYLFTKYSIGVDVSGNNSNISDTVNIITPFIAILAAGLTFLAFWVQFKANEQQRYDIRKERFENTFYELLKFHKQNVEDLKIENLNQRELFQELYYELKLSYNIVYSVFSLEAKTSDDETKGVLSTHPLKNKLNLSYLLFFYGYNYIYSVSANQMNLPEQTWKDIREKIVEEFKKYDEDWQKGNYSLSENKKEGSADMGYIIYKNLSYYKPFMGQSKLLGHYFRNMFQIVKYVDRQNDDFLSTTEKYNYIKTLRAQLSDYEQVLLYYNSLSSLGYDWFDKEKESLIVRYKLIKNAPQNLYWGVMPKQLFKIFEMTEKEIESYFEPKNKLLNF